MGEAFLEWLSPNPGGRWLDVGCGNGAFTEMIAARCAPASLQGVDPFEGQLAYARTRPALRSAEFRLGDAMALPFPAASFEVAVMPLVIFFVPDPAKGVAEMARVVGPGGMVTAYAWDMPNGGFPYATLHAEMQRLGVTVPVPPSPDASRMETLQKLWSEADLEAVETRVITVERTFANFDDYWTTVLGGPSVAAKLTAMAPADIRQLKARMSESLTTDAAGRITYGARANAIKGRVVGKR